MNRVIRLKHDEVRIATSADTTFAVLDAKTSCGVDGAGVQCVVEGHHGFFHKDAQALVDVQGGIEGSMNGKFSFPATNIRDSLEVSITGDLFIKISSPIKWLNGKKSMNMGTLELYPNLRSLVLQ